MTTEDGTVSLRQFSKSDGTKKRRNKQKKTKKKRKANETKIQLLPFLGFAEIPLPPSWMLGNPPISALKVKKQKNK